MVAVDCRIGDFLAQDKHHANKGFYMKLEDIVLTLEGDEPTAENITAFITIKYEKRIKKSYNHRTRRVESFKDATLTTVDLILMLLVHGLRHGLFKTGATLDQVLMAAKARGDRTLRWKYPEYPFVPAMTHPTAGTLTLSTPARYKMAYSTILRMGDISGYLSRLLTHDIRRGAAKDLVRLPKEIMKASDAGTARALGHNDIRSTRFYNI
ncbi:hypothetical protein A1O3_05454 [Capronia epimyces CBS 606.96]|uniref:Uncharacterized protein n=1 Tax=Capronia epimyces CBS 606.96 TaxID=1182542 RepID=W9XW37_9EURO|nr:uncharacterized protein A1O3_05454 [Capronia epimyces CBS 606.96]EXJ84782.1 hypothetical protein A1O3_05454 [Capronia epimyces CBS 606.96]